MLVDPASGTHIHIKNEVERPFMKSMGPPSWIAKNHQ